MRTQEEPGVFSQEEPRGTRGGVRRNLEEPGGTWRSQEGPRGARGGHQEEPVGCARRSNEEPGSQEEPERATQ